MLAPCGIADQPQFVSLAATATIGVSRRTGGMKRMVKVPQQQIPGVYHRRVGDIVVTALSDGFLDGSLDVLRNISQDEARRILTDSFRPSRRTPVNAFLVYSAGRLALIETGSGNYLLPTAGKLLANIKAARIKRILDEVQNKYGKLSLDHLHRVSDEDAKRELMEFDGVGPKTFVPDLLAKVKEFANRADRRDADVHRDGGGRGELRGP